MPHPLLTSLLETLDLLVAQVRAYERALPPDNHAAHSMLHVLGELVRQANTEAADLAVALDPEPTAHPLSAREFEVLGLVVRGLTNKEIAYQLGVSERTIQFHMNAIFQKTHTSSRTEAATFALQHKWLD